MKKRKLVLLNGKPLYISPIELQIAYKLYLGSDKDVEDAYYLYELFREHLKRGLLDGYSRRMGVGIPFKA